LVNIVYHNLVMKLPKFNHIIVSIFILTSAILKSQTQVFLSKPDDHIFKVIGLVQENDNSFDTARILEYDTEGLLKSESIPKFYQFINYSYDNQHRLIGKEALYGESSANGTSLYTYNGDTIIEISLLIDSYRKKITIQDKNKNPIHEINYFAASYSSNSYISEEVYSNDLKGKFKSKNDFTVYYDYHNEAQNYYEMNDDQIISELKSAKQINQSTAITFYKYKKEFLLSEKTYTEGQRKKIHEILYKYNKSNQLKAKKERFYSNNSSVKKNKVSTKMEYNKIGELIEITQLGKGIKVISYYQSGKLKKEIEFASDKKIEPIVTNYQYIYYQ